MATDVLTLVRAQALTTQAAVARRMTFEDLVRGHQDEVYGTALRILGDRETALEVANTTFLKAYRAFDRYDPARPLRHWLLRIAANEAISAGRRISREQARSAGRDAALSLADARPNPESVAIGREDAAAVQAAVLALPELCVTRSADRADVRLEQDFSGFSAPRSVSAKVASDIPMTIRLQSGAGEFTLDLREVKATEVRIETGASSLTLILPRPTGNVPVRIQAGASSIVIEVPAGVEAKVITTGGLISTSGRTETTGYAAATNRVTVNVEAGASSIDVR